MALHGPDVASTSGPARLVSLPVAGVNIGRFQMIDGRPPDSLEDVGDMVLHFRPGTVPLLTRHSERNGRPLGYLDTLQAHDRDLYWTATIELPEDRGVHLRRNGSPVSIETVRTLYPRLDGRPHVDGQTIEALSSTHPYWRGKVHYGMTLVGIALSVQAAARGSVMWVVEG